MAPPGLSVWARAQRTLQPSEAWQTFKDWIDARQPALRLQRRARPGRRLARSRRASALGRADARRRRAAAWRICCRPARSSACRRRRSRRRSDGQPLSVARSAARPHHLPVRAWRADRRAAGQPARRARSTACRSACRIIGAARAATPRWSPSRGRWRQDVTDLTPNIPEVVAEVGALVRALRAGPDRQERRVLDATFWNSPHTIRYAFHENGYGFDAHPRPSRRPAGRARASRKSASGWRS